MNISDYVSQLQSLTNKNLEILKTINDSFYTKSERVTASVDGVNYTIPSFLALENKVNALQASFDNLVNVPSTGEAYVNYDGSSQTIELRGFNCAPPALTLTPPTTFDIESNDVFKDFLHPNPFIRFDLSSLPSDVTEVAVRKVIPKSDALVSRFQKMLDGEVSTSKSWADIYKMLYAYKEDLDYEMYDSAVSLPLRQPTGTATYVVDKVISDTTNDDLEEIISVHIRTDFDGVEDGDSYSSSLTYHLFDGTIEKNLKTGDYLVSYNNGTKLQVIDIKPLSSELTVRVVNGEWLNLVPSTGSTIQDLSKLKFFSEVNYDESKYVNVSLEEDQYVFIAIAAVNGRLRIQAPFGNGVVVDSYSLSYGNTKFKDYYDSNVSNIGDVLYEITSMMSNTLMKYSQDQFDALSSFKPVIDTDSKHLVVTRINKHLDDSASVQNIRSLYSQKKQYSSSLDSVQSEIDRINEELASISFDDTSGQRAALIAALSVNNKKKNELSTSITKIINDISKAANDSDVPLENAKYHIRGFYDFNSIKTANIDDLGDHVKGIEVWYRYKNVSKEQGNAESIGSYVFSDWKKMPSPLRPRVPSSAGGKYSFAPASDNSTINEPSFNQIDIPISQGETVDIKLRVIYDFGYPFITLTSAWSDTVNVEFPEEYTKDVQILDIIEENNNDIETNRFTNILNENGIPDHINDSVTDQDIIYFHKPESISSGFYTSERRIIPLKDKLTDMDSQVKNLMDLITGADSSALSVSLSVGDVVNNLSENITNIISVAAADEIANGDSALLTDGPYKKDDSGKISVMLSFTIANKSSHTVRLYPIFPGPRTNPLADYRFKSHQDYDYRGDGGEIRAVNSLLNKSDGTESIVPQTLNQFICFRNDNVWTGEKYYDSGNTFETDNKLSYDTIQLGGSSGAAMYPVKTSEYAFCTDSDATVSSLVLAPSDSIVIPVCFEYRFNESSKTAFVKTMSVDIRTSLYSDPVNFTFQVGVKKSASSQDKLIRSMKKDTTSAVKYNTTVKA